MTSGANLLPPTRALKLKLYPDRRPCKHKARFFVREDKHIEGVDFFERYAPVFAWSTDRMVMNMAIKKWWETHQVEFANVFIQDTPKEEFCVNLPVMFSDENNNYGKYGVLLKLNKSIYRIAQAPRS